MSILVIGGSGFIGRQLCKALINVEETVIVKTRNAKKTREIFNKLNCSPTIIENYDSLVDIKSCLSNVICLNGAGVVDKRWTASRKQELIDSRTLPLLELKEWLTNNNVAIEKFLVGSAIGYYGFSDNPEQEFSENSVPFKHFAHDLCNQLEDTARTLDRLCESIVMLRTGVVLGKDGGALTKMAMPAKFHMNGTIGNGKQWISWIHMQDWINATKYILSTEEPRHSYNLTSPKPSTNANMSIAIAKAVNKPFQLPVPTLSLKLLLGEASILLTGSQKVLPTHLQAANFEFTYPEIENAVSSLL